MKKSLWLVLLIVQSCTGGTAFTFFDSSNGIGEKTFEANDVEVVTENGISTVTVFREERDDNPEAPSYTIVVKIDENTDELISVKYTYDQNPTIENNEGVADCAGSGCDHVTVNGGRRVVKFEGTEVTGLFEGDTPWSIKIKGQLSY
ncbi:MAG: hypothetical protein R2877_01890 [Bdellovibrionota bacterium]